MLRCRNPAAPLPWMHALPWLIHPAGHKSFPEGMSQGRTSGRGISAFHPHPPSPVPFQGPPEDRIPDSPGGQPPPGNQQLPPPSRSISMFMAGSSSRCRSSQKSSAASTASSPSARKMEGRRRSIRPAAYAVLSRHPSGLNA